MRRRLLALAAVGAIVAVGAAGASGGDAPRTYFVEFDSAFGLVEGGDLRVGGVRAGETSDLAVVERGARPVARVELRIDEQGFDSFRADARCAVRQQSLIGEYFVDCEPGSASKELPEGSVIGVGRTSSTVAPDVVNNILRRPYRERLRLILTELGSGLAGRPQDIQEVLRRGHPGLRETEETLGILARQNHLVEDFIRDADTVVAELERRKGDVARSVTEAGETAEISATRRDRLAEQFRKLPRFLDELEPTMARLGDLTAEQGPLLRDLREAAPDLEALFDELGPFAEAARPSLRSLGRAADVGTRALRRSREEVRALRELSEDSGSAGRNLRQFLQTLDTRRRAINVDPRAAQTDPPAPDPTHIPEGEKTGFTGFESLWNYFYWQTLGTNGFDEISHILRVVGFESPCADYSADPSVELQEQCASHLGPYQPGLLKRDGSGERWPDPTDRDNDGIQDTYEAQGGGSDPHPGGEGGGSDPHPGGGSDPPPAAPEPLLDFLLAP